MQSAPIARWHRQAPSRCLICSQLCSTVQWCSCAHPPQESLLTQTAAVAPASYSANDDGLTWYSQACRDARSGQIPSLSMNYHSIGGCRPHVAPNTAL